MSVGNEKLERPTKRWGEGGRGDPTEGEGDTMVAKAIDRLAQVDVQGRSKRVGRKGRNREGEED